MSEAYSELFDILKESRKNKAAAIRSALEPELDDGIRKHREILERIGDIQERYSREVSSLKELIKLTEEGREYRAKHMKVEPSPTDNPTLTWSRYMNTKPEWAMLLAERTGRQLNSPKRLTKIRSKAAKKFGPGEHVILFPEDMQMEAVLDAMADLVIKAKGDLSSCEREFNERKSDLLKQSKYITQAYEQNRSELLKVAALEMVDEFHQTIELMNAAIAEDKARNRDYLREGVHELLRYYDDADMKKLLCSALVEGYGLEKVIDKVEGLVRNDQLGGQDGIKVSLTVRAYTLAAGAQIVVPECEVDQSGVRLAMLTGIVGESVAQRVVDGNPALARSGWSYFASYLGQLKNAASHFREQLGHFDMEQMSSVEGLNGLMRREIANRTVREVLDERLRAQGYDPLLIHGFIMAFKPDTKRYIGRNYIPREAARKNLRGQIGNMHQDFDGLLGSMIDARVILDNKGPVSLNPNPTEVKDAVLRDALSLYLARS